MIAKGKTVGLFDGGSFAGTLAACIIVAAIGFTNNQECRAAGFAECSDCNIGGYSTMDGGGYSDCWDGCSDCTIDCGCNTKCCDCRPWAHRTSWWGEYLYLQPTGVDMVHAQQQNGTGGAGTVPWGQIGAVDPDYSSGYRLGMNICCDDCSSVGVSYTFFESDAINAVFAPNIPGGGGAVGSLVHHPAADIVSSAGPLTAHYNIDFQLVDVACRRLLHGDNCSWVNYSVGARFAQLEQDFFQFGQFSGSQSGNITTRTATEFNGGGLRFGLDGERIIGCCGFSCFANVAVSPVVGQFNNYYLEQNESTATQLAYALWKDDRFVTILDYELGVAWTGCCGHLRVSAGYMGSFWYNAITTPEFVDAVQADNYVDLGDTLSFDGLTTRVEVRF